MCGSVFSRVKCVFSGGLRGRQLQQQKAAFPGWSQEMQRENWGWLCHDEGWWRVLKGDEGWLRLSSTSSFLRNPLSDGKKLHRTQRGWWSRRPLVSLKLGASLMRTRYCCTNPVLLWLGLTLMSFSSSVSAASSHHVWSADLGVMHHPFLSSCLLTS